MIRFQIKQEKIRLIFTYLFILSSIWASSIIILFQVTMSCWRNYTDEYGDEHGTCKYCWEDEWFCNENSFTNIRFRNINDHEECLKKMSLVIFLVSTLIHMIKGCKAINGDEFCKCIMVNIVSINW